MTDKIQKLIDTIIQDCKKKVDGIKYMLTQFTEGSKPPRRDPDIVERYKYVASLYDIVIESLESAKRENINEVLAKIIPKIKISEPEPSYENSIEQKKYFLDMLYRLEDEIKQIYNNEGAAAPAAGGGLKRTKRRMSKRSGYKRRNTRQKILKK
jgi:hypothetical protein